MTIVDYFKEMHRAFNHDRDDFYRIPEKKSDIMDYYEVGNSKIVNSFVSPDKMEARITFQTRWDTNEEARKSENYIKQYMKEKLGGNYSFKITGMSQLYLSIENNLKDSQISSIMIAVIIIFKTVVERPN